jgi:hypothetical protein
MKHSVLALLVVALASAACGNNSQSATAPATTTPSPGSSGTFETFAGVLGIQGSSLYSFTVTTAGTVSIALTSLTPNATGPASTSTVRVGLGVPIGTGCSVNSSVDTAAGLTTQLTASVTPDTYCVNISDIGNLTAPMNFQIRIGHDVTSSPSTTTTTETFASFLSIGGASARTLSITQSGTISVTLTSVTPSTTVGLGIGIAGQGTPPCNISRSVDATAASSPQLTVDVDPGTYCAEVFDSGNLSNPGVAFSMTIVHP